MSFKYSTEAIDHQKDLTFFKGLTRCIQELRAQPEDTWNTVSLRKTGINELVEKQIGIPCNMTIDKAEHPNAFVNIPDLNKNHPFMRKWQGIAKSKDGLKLLDDKDFNILCIDRKNAKIKGVFAKSPMHIHLTSALIESKTITAAEIAAIILHEIGHIFSFLETMWLTQRTNLAITSALEDCVGAKDPQVKQAILKSAKDQGILDKEFDEKKAALLDDKDLTVVVVSSSFRSIEERQSSRFFSSLTYAYNNTAWEQSADQFAVRMGAGADLATALNKIQPASELKRQFFILTIMEILFKNLSLSFSWALVFSGTIAGVILGLWLVFIFHKFWSSISWNDLEGDYDKPSDRLERMRRELIGKLKMLDKKDPQVVETLKQLDVLKEEIAKTEDWPTSLDSWWTKVVIGFIFRTNSRKEMEQTIEKLINNNLYESGHRFQQLAKK